MESGKVFIITARFCVPLSPDPRRAVTRRVQVEGDDAEIVNEGVVGSIIARPARTSEGRHAPVFVLQFWHAKAARQPAALHMLNAVATCSPRWCTSSTRATTPTSSPRSCEHTSETHRHAIAATRHASPRTDHGTVGRRGLHDGARALPELRRARANTREHTPVTRVDDARRPRTHQWTLSHRLPGSPKRGWRRRASRPRSRRTCPTPINGRGSLRYVSATASKPCRSFALVKRRKRSSFALVKRRKRSIYLATGTTTAAAGA